MTTYRPPRLNDVMHTSVGDGPEHTTILDAVSDDGRTIVYTGPTPHGPLRVVIRRVDRYLTKLEKQ